MSAAVTGFLADTLLWTGALIALVLLVRRPVARWCGAELAYALWVLPFARLILPPVTLPAALAPIPAIAPAALPSDPVSITEGGGEVAMAALPDAVPFAAALPEWSLLLVTFWLVGAAVFLARRFGLYFALRDQLLADARPVGELGKVKLMETPAINGPVAFGVIGKVIALPVGFMASHDRIGRDLAIAHEYQHHLGRDLLVNVLIQPLFALHWWNPLGHAGWRALRRDQEAACDARVVARCDRATKAHYAGVIADFARRPKALPRPVLAAAMACPVLGDKSVIQRLRNLTMSEVSAPRRVAGRALLGASLLVLPATATIAYADALVPEAPDVPELSEVPASPPEPDAPFPTDASLPPQAVAASDAGEVEIVSHGSGADARTVIIMRTRDAAGREHVTRRAVGGEVGEMTPEDRAEFVRDMAELERDLAEDARERERELAQMQRELDQDLRDMERDLAEATRELEIDAHQSRRVSTSARAHASAAMRAAASVPEVVEACPDPRKPVVNRVRNGRNQIVVCKSAGATIRREVLLDIRRSIATDPNIPDAERAAGLRDIEKELTRAPRVSAVVRPMTRASHQSAADICPDERLAVSRSA